MDYDKVLEGYSRSKRQRAQQRYCNIMIDTRKSLYHMYLGHTYLILCYMDILNMGRSVSLKMKIMKSL